MQDRVIVDATFSAIIDAPFENVDLPAWCFALPDEDYQGCSPAHVAAGATTARDGRRMSINVEVIGGVPMVQHYVETLGEPHHLVLESVSDLFAAAGRTTIYVLWELTVKRVSSDQCELSNRVLSRATDEFLRFLDRQGIPFDVFRTQRQPMSIAHNQGETPFFAASIARHAQQRRQAA